MYHDFFILPPADGHADCFCVMATGNHAAVNTAMHVSFLIMVFSGYMPSSGTAKRNKSESVLLR